MGADLKIAVVIPCYRVKDHILDVIDCIGPEVSKIYVVDDACPDGSGKFVQKNSKDKRLSFTFHEENQGVGGAVISGYKAAYADGADVIVKIDGDGQMDPSQILRLVEPLTFGFDYSKGNRFDNLQMLRKMPTIRLLGNAILSLVSKFASGYWSVNDPTNGYTAITASTLEGLAFEKISKSYFFESDMLFQLSLINASVADVSIGAIYGSEKSNLRISRAALEFPVKHFGNFCKRIFYKYYLREWTVASLEIPVSIILASVGTISWLGYFLNGVETGAGITAGQVTFSSLAIMLAVQLGLAALSYDIASEPKVGEKR